MDERVFRAKIGVPIPDWDAKHQLPLGGRVGPEIADSGTVFELNSTFMDISDQPNMMRQWYAGGTLVAGLMTIPFAYLLIFIFFIDPPSKVDGGFIAATCVFLLGALLLGVIAVRFGRDEFFWLRRRPIRFNRATKKIYAIRNRRYRNASTAGDFCSEIPWDDSSVFCVHKGPAKFELGEQFHIRCYQVDEKGNVIRAFAIGREWQGIDGMTELLAQWNYWCAYMNTGPEVLPLPLLYLSEREDIVESFLYCLYELGFNLSPAVRTMFMPFVLFLTGIRLISMWTCRYPIWPAAVSEVSDIQASDQYVQPRGATPVGWAATAQARRRGKYPLAPRCSTPNWSGEQDSILNAQHWIRGK
jgi:hypothetical protein